jgi:hypothetical protein
MGGTLGYGDSAANVVCDREWIKEGGFEIADSGFMIDD